MKAEKEYCLWSNDVWPVILPMCKAAKIGTYPKGYVIKCPKCGKELKAPYHMGNRSYIRIPRHIHSK